MSIQLPPPRETSPGASVFASLQLRKTTRDISSAELPSQVVSNVLWAAAGVNRPKGSFGCVGRTAASASNSQEILLFAATENGIYEYDPLNHVLNLKVPGDHRAKALTPHQRGVNAVAPLHLIYVADIDRLEHTQGFDEPTLHLPDGQKSYYFTDCGLMAGNVYLLAASLGLAAWFHNCDRAWLKTHLALPEKCQVLFGQSVGWPHV